MMEFLKKNMVLVGGATLLFVGIVVYLNFFAGASSEALLTTSEQPGSPVSKDLLVMLSNLNTIQLEVKIFDDPVYQSLTNFGVVLPGQEAGRPNPFLPVEADAR